jgi:hypothetical protein
MRRKLPRNYKGKKNRKGLIVFLSVIFLIFSGTFVMWNLDDIVHFFQGSHYLWVQPQGENASPDTPKESQSPEAKPDESEAPSVLQRTVGVYMPVSQANSPQSILEFSARAKEQGANAIILDIKDADGRILFETPLGYSFMSAVTVENAFDLRETVDLLKQEGFYLTARMSCFYDNLAPRKNPAMAILTNGVTWLDWDYKSWLNPYSQLTMEYLGDLAEYFTRIGFDEILLYNVEFPVRGKTELISYSAEDSIANKQAALSNFLKYMKVRISDSATVALQVSSSLLIEDPKELSGIDLKRLIPQVDVFVPQIYPSVLPLNIKIGEELIGKPKNEVEQTISALCKLCKSLTQNNAVQVEIRPMIQGFDTVSNGEMVGICDASMMQAQIEALAQNQMSQYDIYQPEGIYQHITQ